MKKIFKTWKIEEFQNFKDFFIDFLEKNHLNMVSDLNFFLPGLKMSTKFINYAARATF